MPEIITPAEPVGEISTPTDPNPPVPKPEPPPTPALPAPGPDPESAPDPDDGDTGDADDEETEPGPVGLPAVPLLANAINLSTVGVCSSLSAAGPVAAIAVGTVAAAGVGALGLAAVRSARTAEQRRAQAATTTRAGRTGGTGAAGGAGRGGGRVRQDAAGRAGGDSRGGLGGRQRTAGGGGAAGARSGRRFGGGGGGGRRGVGGLFGRGTSAADTGGGPRGGRRTGSGAAGGGRKGSGAAGGGLWGRAPGRHRNGRGAFGTNSGAGFAGSGGRGKSRMGRFDTSAGHRSSGVSPLGRGGGFGRRGRSGSGTGGGRSGSGSRAGGGGSGWFSGLGKGGVRRGAGGLFGGRGSGRYGAGWAGSGTQRGGGPFSGSANGWSGLGRKDRRDRTPGPDHRRGAVRQTLKAAQGRLVRAREAAGQWLRQWGARLRERLQQWRERAGTWLKAKMARARQATHLWRRRNLAKLRHLLRLAAAVFFATVAALAVMPAALFVGAAANIPAALNRRFRFTDLGMNWPGRVFRKVWKGMADASRRRLHAQLADMATPITGDRAHVRHVCDDPGADTGAPVATESTVERGEHVSVFATSAEEVANTYAAYDPPAMAAVAAEYKGLPDAIRNINGAVMALAENSAAMYPMDPAMAEGVAQVAQVLEATAAYADELEPTFRQVHDLDIMRLENPRTNEHWWNVGGIDGDGALWAKPSVLATAAEEVSGVYEQWSPEAHADAATNPAMVVGAEYEGVPVGLEHLAQAVTYLATRSAECYPVDPCIAEMVADVVHGLRKAESAAMELHPAFRRLHCEEIDHNENPRNGEHMWNVPRDGGQRA
ncbi:hypothetical protein [Streptomyces sp. NPDC045470]|uniref:hypothetical protein n=1 Tax=Streptomyces sp. NPDC045470 TaxID=3155469 RepID=UPI0033F1CDBE